MYSVIAISAHTSTWLNARDLNLELDSANLGATSVFSPGRLLRDLAGPNKVNLIYEPASPSNHSHISQDLVRRQWFTFVEAMIHLRGPR